MLKILLIILLLIVIFIIAVVCVGKFVGAKWALLTAVVLPCIVLLCGIGYYYWGGISNPANRATVGDISTPLGYTRVEYSKNSFGNYLRTLPLKSRGSMVHLYTGGLARLQGLSYAVIDQKLLSNDEQCADVCMRLRAEYLYAQGRYNEIKFKNVNGKWMYYSGGKNRKAFERFMRNVYGYCNTASMQHSMQTRPLKELQAGDVFVYKARPGRKYGHAVLVADVAVNARGQKAFLLIEGNTPARDKHVMRNPLRPCSSPWFYLDEEADVIYLTPFYFTADDLKKW